MEDVAVDDAKERDRKWTNQTLLQRTEAWLAVVRKQGAPCICKRLEVPMKRSPFPAAVASFSLQC